MQTSDFSYFGYDKLHNATHYIVARAGDLGRDLDSIQLNKVLWYADSLCYMAKGQPITGTLYKRKPRGPVAANHNRVLNTLVNDGLVRQGHAEKNGRFRSVIDSIEDPETTQFTEAELELFNRVLDYVTTETTTNEISDQSHGDIWKLARDGEELPLYTVFAERLGDPTPGEIEEAKKGFRH